MSAGRGAECPLLTQQRTAWLKEAGNAGGFLTRAFIEASGRGAASRAQQVSVACLGLDGPKVHHSAAAPSGSTLERFLRAAGAASAAPLARLPALRAAAGVLGAASAAVASSARRSSRSLPSMLSPSFCGVTPLQQARGERRQNQERGWHSMLQVASRGSAYGQPSALPHQCCARSPHVLPCTSGRVPVRSSFLARSLPGANWRP